MTTALWHDSPRHADVLATAPDGLESVAGSSEAPRDCVIALHAFASASSSSANSCLQFQRDQLIHVLTRDPSGWWWGRLEDSDEPGWFPSNYTSPYAPPSQRQQTQLPSPVASSVARPMLRSQSEGPSLGLSNEPLPSVIQAIRFVQEAAEARRVTHYQPSVAVVISGIRTVLSNSDCLAKESATLRQHPPLVQTRRDILANLARLVQQARKCAAVASDELASEFEIEQLLNLSKLLLKNASQFISYLQQHRVLPGSSSSIKASESTSTVRAAMNKQRTKSMGDLKSRRKLAEHAEQLHQAQLSSEGMMRLGSNASSTSDASIWPPSLSSAASSSDSLDGPRTPHDLRGQAANLDAQHDQLLPVIAAFIGHVHAHTRASHPSSYSHLVDMTGETVLLARDVLTLVEECERSVIDIHDREDLAASRRSFYAAADELVRAVDIAIKEPDADLDETEEEEKDRLLRSATSLLRCASDSVGQVKKVLRSEAASRVFDMVAAPQPKSIQYQPPTRYAFESFVDQHDPSSFLRERHTLSMLGRTADSLDHLRLQYEQRDSLSFSVGSSSRSPHSSCDSSGSNQSASAPVAELPAFTPASIRPLNTLSNRRGQQAPAPLNLDKPIPEEDQFDDPLSASLPSASLPSQDSPSKKAIQRATEKSLPASPVSNSSQTSSPSRTSAEGSLQEPALNRGYEAKEVLFNSDGDVIGGTLRCLVERMSLHDTPVDSSFAQTFFLTFRLFASPSELVNALVSRFDLAPPEDLGHEPQDYETWCNRVAKPVRLRVLNMIKTWLESHWQPDTDSAVLVPLHSFTQNKVIPILGQAALRVTDLIQKRSIRPQAQGTVHVLHRAVSTDRMRQGKPALDGVPLHLDSPSSATFSAVPPPPSLTSKGLLNTIRTVPFTRLSVTEFDPLEIARQFTIMESRLFCMIQPQELFMQIKGKSPPRNHVSAIKQMSALSTNITGWIAETILSEQDAKRRTQALKWFLKLADRCLTLQNFSTLTAVMAALGSSTIARLTKTWDGLAPKYKVLVERLRKLTEHARNYAEYRAALRSATPPALPFLGLCLTDLTFSHEGNAPTKPSQLDPELKLINFDRYRRMTKVVTDLQRFQVPFNLTEVPEIQSYLTQSLQSMDALGGNNVERLYRRSLVLEPRDTQNGPAPSMPPRPAFAASMTPLSPVLEKRFEGAGGASIFGKGRARTAV